MNIKDALITLPQYVLPHHALSKMMSKLTHCENKAWKNLFIKQIIRYYGVNMDEALEQDINAFKSFNDFFTRELKPGVRPLTTERYAIASPADGAVSQAGNITDGKIFQAKGKSFTATDLLGGSEERAKPFNNVCHHLPFAQRLSSLAYAFCRHIKRNGAYTRPTIQREYGNH
jgi:phosphatidylserine decarboxylase